MNAVIAKLEKEVAETTEVIKSAILLIEGIAESQRTAIEAALANGATAEELKPISDEVDALSASTDALSAAVAANTPSAPPA